LSRAPTDTGYELGVPIYPVLMGNIVGGAALFALLSHAQMAKKI
jgi:formate/nitrite transporter FocA (FNT family)